MNLLGKIFVVLIFVMSLVWMSLALGVYASHRNWRDVVLNPKDKESADKPVGLKFVVEDLKAKNKAMQDELAKVTAERDAVIASKRQAVTKLETERDALQQDRDAQVKLLAEKTQSEREAVAAMTAAHETLAAQRTEVDGLRKDIADTLAAREKAVVEMVERTDLLHQTANEMRLLKAESFKTLEDLKRYEEAMKVLGVNGRPPQPYEKLPSGLDGLVVDARGDGLIEVSLGSDDGVQKGHQLEVFRAAEGVSTYLGRVEVVTTTADRSVCQVIPNMVKGTIVRGDRVASQLN